MLLKKISLIVLSLLIVSADAAASVNSDLKSYFNQLGSTANVTNPTAYNGQAGGYYTGGSIYTRNSIRNVELVHMDTPSIKSGCGGIDLYAGGISYISRDELVDAMKSLMSNGASYAMTLALEEASPLIANILKFWKQAADAINSQNFNSCETSEALVSGLWSKDRLSKQRMCEDLGTNNSEFSGWAEARQGCGNGGSYNDVMKDHGDDPRYKDLMTAQGNLAWKALQKSPLFSIDTELGYLFMSISGTIVIKPKETNSSDNKDVTFDISAISSKLATDRSLINSLLHGGKATVYFCKDGDSPNKCLDLGTKDITIDASNAFATQIQVKLEDMAARIKSDQALTSDEKNILEMTSLPIYKILNVMVAYNGTKSPYDIGSYADIIASDILFQYLEENLAIVRGNAALFSYPEDEMKKFNDGITLAFNTIRDSRRTAYDDFARTNVVIESTQSMERAVAANLSTQVSNSMNWAKGLGN